MNARIEAAAKIALAARTENHTSGRRPTAFETMKPQTRAYWTHTGRMILAAYDADPSINSILHALVLSQAIQRGKAIYEKAKADPQAILDAQSGVTSVAWLKTADTILRNLALLNSPRQDNTPDVPANNHQPITIIHHQVPAEAPLAIAA
jgi:hypothetical protein